MTDSPYREEALEYLVRQRGPGELLQVSARWMDAAYWGFLVLVAAGVVASLLIQIDGEPLLRVLVPLLKPYA